MSRTRLDDDKIEELSLFRDNYFTAQRSPLQFISTGCTVLDRALGGGWPLGRIVNIVGDSSTGKTLLAIEASAEFAKKWPRGRVFYRESESAFDDDYAAALGMPVDVVEKLPPDEFLTVEDFQKDLTARCAEVEKSRQPALYVCDSLDALSDDAEMKADIDKGTYGTSKAKQMSRMFRMVTEEVSAANMCLIVVSQTRQKIGSMFSQKTRAGGDALNFYASQILWLSHLEDIEKTRAKVKRVTGIWVRAKVTKSKIALPKRTCDFAITFGHGIDNVRSNLDFLENVDGAWAEVFDVKRETYEKHLVAMTDADYWKENERVSAEVVRVWREVEERFMREVRQKPR